MKKPAHIVDMGRLLLYIMLWTMIGAFLLFFPIVLQSDAHYDMNRRKFGFAIVLYKKIKLIGGYVATYQGGLALHISSKKAILIPYSEIDNERKRFSFIKSLRLIAFTLTTETGAEYLLPVSVAHMLLRTVFFLLGGEKDKIENNLWLTDGDVLRVSFHIVAYFNLFMLLYALCKFVKEKIKILWQKKMKKSTN